MILLLVAFIWGSGFIATQMAIDNGYSTSFILAYRFIVSSVLFGVIFRKDLKKILNKVNYGGVVVGLLLFFSFTLQTYGLEYTSPSNNAFITATNVVFVPFLSWLIFKIKPKINSFLAAIICLVGVTILSIDFSVGFTSFGIGELLTFGSAVCFALHTVSIGYYSSKMETKAIIFLQIFTAGILSIILFVFVDGNFAEFIPNTKQLPVLYLAIFSTSVCYFLQTKAQSVVSPTKTSIVISTESLFATTMSIILGYETLKSSIIVGGVLILCSVLLAEIDFSSFGNKKKPVE